MKKIIFLLITLLIIPSIFAINLEVEKKSSNEVMVAELNQPAIFDLEITNLGETDKFEFFNLAGFNMVPKGTGIINEDETKEIELKIYPREDFDIRGFYTLGYSLKGKTANISNHELTIKIIDLEEAFEIGVEKFKENSSEITIYIQNKENFNFEELDVKFSSAFFETEKNLSLEPNKRKTFDLTLNKEDFNKLNSGFYTMKAEIKVDDQKAEVEGLIKFEENKDLKTTTKDYGFFINTQIITKENQGNVIENSQIIIEKNILSRLFTTLSPEPDVIERNDLKIKYIWEEAIKPGESFEVNVKTNWFFPLIVIALLVTIVGMLKHFSRRDIVLKKKVNFVHAKGGEFALRVTILVQAKKYVENVRIIDRIPTLVKIYHKFGGQNPIKLDEEKRKIEWSFEKLEAGEIRILSYVIYSKVGIIGKFSLPIANALYERDGELKESESNHVYFMAEALKGDEGSDED